MMRKQILKGGILFALFALNAYLFFWKDGEKGSLDDSVLMLEDTSPISSILITLPQYQTNLTKTPTGWMINNTYETDKQFVNTLLNVFQHLKVRSTYNDISKIEARGDITIKFTDREDLSFGFGTNSNRTKSFLFIDKKNYEVAMVGYAENVLNLFMLHPDQWRSRILVDMEEVQKIGVKYVTPSDMSMNWTLTRLNNQYAINNQPIQEDKGKSYMRLFDSFEANEMISEGRFPSIDSIQSSDKWVSMFFSDGEQTQTFDVFNLSNQPNFYLLQSKETTTIMMLVDKKRLNQLLKGAE